MTRALESDHHPLRIVFRAQVFQHRGRRLYRYRGWVHFVTRVALRPIAVIAPAIRSTVAESLTPLGAVTVT